MKGNVKTMSIEEYIKRLPKKELNSNRISVVLYDPNWNNYHLMYKINVRKDTCIMMSTSIYPGMNFTELTLPFISQLNAYYGHCVIDKSNTLIGLKSIEAKKKLENKTD